MIYSQGAEDLDSPGAEDWDKAVSVETLACSAA